MFIIVLAAALIVLVIVCWFMAQALLGGIVIFGAVRGMRSGARAPIATPAVSQQELNVRARRVAEARARNPWMKD